MGCGKHFYYVAGFIMMWPTLLVDHTRVRVSVAAYSTVTDFARLRGLSTSVPRANAVW